MRLESHFPRWRCMRLESHFPRWRCMRLEAALLNSSLFLPNGGGGRSAPPIERCDVERACVRPSGSTHGRGRRESWRAPIHPHAQHNTTHTMTRVSSCVSSRRARPRESAAERAAALSLSRSLPESRLLRRGDRDAIACVGDRHDDDATRHLGDFDEAIATMRSRVGDDAPRRRRDATRHAHR